MLISLPQVPFNGQIFIDAQRIKWQWDATNSVWQQIGFVDSVPIADYDTPGLLDHTLKKMIDAVPEAGGGFGFIVSPKSLFTDGKLDGIVTGEITIKSESLDFTSTDYQGVPLVGFNGDYVAPEDGENFPGFSVTISPEFLQSFCVELVGPPGLTGERGDKGDQGKDGYNNSPAGPKGDKGNDALEFKTFTGVQFEDVSDIYSEAIIGIEYDRSTSTFTANVAKMNVPNNDDAAEQFNLTPISRSVTFNSESNDCYTTLDDWSLIARSDDEIPDSPDLYIFNVPVSAKSGDEIEAKPILLSDYVTKVTEYYKNKLTEIDEKWQLEVKELITSTDDAARKELSSVASQLANCEFQKPIQFCMGIDMPSEEIPSPSAEIVIPSIDIPVLEFAVILCIIDESIQAWIGPGLAYWGSDASVYSEDKSKWDGLVAELKSSGYHVRLGLLQPLNPIAPGPASNIILKHDAFAFPADTDRSIMTVNTYNDIATPLSNTTLRVTAERIVETFDLIVGTSFNPTLCVFTLDDSGSMSVDDDYGGPGAPALEEAKILLANKYPGLQFLSNITKSDEKWLNSAYEGVQDILDAGGI